MTPSVGMPQVMRGAQFRLARTRTAWLGSGVVVAAIARMILLLAKSLGWEWVDEETAKALAQLLDAAIVALLGGGLVTLRDAAGRGGANREAQ